jgi:hypothetical protein
MVGVQQDNRFEFRAGFGGNVGFGKEFDFIANELDAFPMTAIDNHHQTLDFIPVAVVDPMDKFLHQRQLSRSRYSMENNVWNTVIGDESVETLTNRQMDRQHYFLFEK